MAALHSPRLPPGTGAATREYRTILLHAGILAALLMLTALLYRDQAYNWVFILGALTYGAILWWAASWCGKFDARFLFLAVSGFYPFTPVLDLMVFGNSNFDERSSAFTLLLTMTFFVAFYVFAYGDWLRAAKKTVRRDPMDSIDVRRIIAGLAVGLALYALLFQQIIGFFHDLTRGEIYQLDTSALAGMRFVMQIGMLVLIARLRLVWLIASTTPIAFLKAFSASARGPLLAVVALMVPAAYFAIDLFLLGDRRFVITFVLAAAAILAPRRLSLLAVITGFIAVAALILLGAVRDQPMSEWLEVFQSDKLAPRLELSKFEFAYFSRIADDILRSMRVEDYPTYVQSLLTTLPRIIYPDRPLGFGEWYVKTYYPDYWAMGGGYAANLIIEALLNWGPAGPAMLGGLIGVFFVEVIKLGGRNRFGHGMLIFAVVFAMRFDMATLLKGVALAWLAAAAWILLCSARPFFRLGRATNERA